MSDAPVVIQEGGARIYMFANVRYPSVTTVIDRFFPFWRGSNQDEAAAAAFKGTAVHNMCAELTQNIRFAPMRIDSFPDAIMGYGHSWLKFMEAMRARVISQERALLSLRYRVAGRPDAIMEFEINGKTYIIDYTVGATRIAKRLQTAAYALLWKELHPKQRRKIHRIEVPLKENGDLPTLRMHNDDRDRHAFLSAVNLYRWEEAA